MATNLKDEASNVEQGTRSPRIQDCNNASEDRVAFIARTLVELHARSTHAERLDALGGDFGRQLEARVAQRMAALIRNGASVTKVEG